MADDEVLTTLVELLQNFNRFNLVITKSTRLEDDFGIDSLGLLILISEIEMRFGISVDPVAEKTRKNFNTVGALCSFISMKIEGP